MGNRTEQDYFVAKSRQHKRYLIIQWILSLIFNYYMSIQYLHVWI